MTDPKIVEQYRAFINCPSLWAPHSAPFPLFPFPWRESVLATKNIVVPENVVFGRKMESFFSHAIANSKGYDLLAENLQVISEKVTLGELDFIVFDNEKQQLIHVELACKFYLLDPSRKVENEFSPWVGPNQNDFLDRKIGKLKNKQFPLLYHPECKNLLAPIIGIYKCKDIKQQVHFPAHLYLPFGKNDIPKNVNPEALKGFWLQPEKLQSTTFKNAQFLLPPKKDWLLEPENKTQWLSTEQALAEIKKMHTLKKSPLVWVKLGNGSFIRLFVVWW